MNTPAMNEPARTPPVDPATYWFSTVEIEVNSRCNRRCDYCPVSLIPAPPVPKFMAPEVFDAVLRRLEEVRYQGKISYHFYNEPLVRRDLHELVAEVRNRLPKVYQLLYTNGDYLDDERFSELDAAGIDHFLVTRHDDTTIKARPKQTVQFGSDLTLTNRGGMMTQIKLCKEPLKQPCFAPFDFLTITVTGDVVLCCDDARRENVMGNIVDQSIEEIWFSNEFIRIRRELARGNRAGATSLCAGCSSPEFTAPGENYHNYLT